jgi:hypothetical protein
VFPYRDVRATSRCRAGVAADPTIPSWSWADLRSSFAAAYRAIRFRDPPATFRRSMGSSAATPASADCSTYSPHSQGLRPSSRVFTRGYLSRRALSSAARRASLGVSCPSAHARPAGPLARGFHAPLRSGHEVSTSSPAYSPRALPAVFHAGAPMGFALQGFAPPGPSAPLPRPHHPHDVGCPPAAHFAAAEVAPFRRATRKPVLRASRPRSPLPAAGCSPDAAGERSPPGLPSSLGPLPPPAAPPRSAASPHGLPDGFRTCALQPPRPSGVFTASGPARLREPSSPSEVLSPF